MGIKGLYQLIKQNAPNSITPISTTDYSGEPIAYDISLFLYQFLSSIRSGSESNFNSLSTNDESTSHLVGLFYRCIKIIENSIKPIFVFDGAPPKAKMEEIKLRKELKEKAEKEYLEALKQEDFEKAGKLAGRSIKITKDQINDSKTLLKLFGFPVVQAPFEAESQCAELAKGNGCVAVASEDSDLLPLGCPVLLKNFSSNNKSNSNAYSKSKNPKEKVKIELDKVLKGLELDMNMFVDLCVLCGSDYGGKVEKMGPKTALKMLKEFKNLESLFDRFLDSFGNSKNKENKKFIKYSGESKEECIKTLEKLKQAREQFINPKIIRYEDLKDSLVWKKPDYDELINFLVSKGFNKERLGKNIEKIKNIKKKGIQTRLTGFIKKKSK